MERDEEKKDLVSILTWEQPTEVFNNSDIAKCPSHPHGIDDPIRNNPHLHPNRKRGEKKKAKVQ